MAVNVTKVDGKYNAVCRSCDYVSPQYRTLELTKQVAIRHIIEGCAPKQPVYDEHECGYYRTGEIRPEPEADYVVTKCNYCGREMLFEATESDYRELVNA